MQDHQYIPSITIWAKKKPRIVEGKLRTLELANYLKSLNLPMYVSLSEDATNIKGSVEYAAKLNQIIGLVLPFNEDTGMPISSNYEATSATNMENILLDPNIPIANVVNVVMAQPLLMNTSPFCLLVYGGNGKYLKEHVKKKWAFIVKELKNVGVTALVFASDSDPRYNGCMRDLILDHRSDELSLFPAWFEFDYLLADYFPMQDQPHIGTKLRNRALDDKIQLKIGKHDVSKKHLFALLDEATRDQHGIFRSDIENHDKMNFNSVQRMSDPKVIELLKQHVDGSDGTIMYLNLMNRVLRSFLDFSLTPLERIYNIWYVVFLLRMWKKEIVEKKLKTENYITNNTYICIEVNAHSLVSIILYLKANRLDQLFLPHLMSSQASDFFFREYRSMSSMGNSFTTTSVMEMIQRCERIALMNEISRVNCPSYTFVTESKRARDIYYNTNKDGYKTIELPSAENIIKEIESAKSNAVKDAYELGIRINESYDFKSGVKRSRKSTSDLTQYRFVKTDGTRLRNFPILQLKDYSRKIIFSNFDNKSVYVAVDDTNLNGIGERRIYVKKYSLCKLYTQQRPKLSSDRGRRTKQKAPKKPSPRTSREAIMDLLELSFSENSDESDEKWNEESDEAESSSHDNTVQSDEYSDSDLADSFNILALDK